MKEKKNFLNADWCVYKKTNCKNNVENVLHDMHLLRNYKRSFFFFCFNVQYNFSISESTRNEMMDTVFSIVYIR